jgi:hypothetical protein
MKHLNSSNDIIEFLFKFYHFDRYIFGSSVATSYGRAPVTAGVMAEGLRRWSRDNWFQSTMVRGKENLRELVRDETGMKVVSSELLVYRKGF